MHYCESCNKSFNGIEPFESHRVSEEHKKKINKPKPISQDQGIGSVLSTDWELEPFIINIEEEYKCTVCKVFLNSVDQVQSHIRGAKHLKAKDSKCVSQDLENDTIQSTDWELEPFIIKIEEEYKCTVCEIFLNSVDQVQSHIRGANHSKAKDSFMKLDEFLSSNQNIHQNYRDSLSFSQTKYSPSKLYLPIDKVKESIDIKVFQAIEKIKF